MAGVAECKKRRAFNFSQDELEALVQAVEDRKHVLFGKFSVTGTSQSKDSNWKEVADSVSVVCGMLRTVESTKKKWSSLASDAKIRGVLQRRDQAKTGAGLPEVKPLTSLEEKILAVMGQVYTEAKKKKHTGLQEELLELEKEKLLLMREKLNIDKERLQLEKDKFEFMKEYLRNRGNNIFDLSEL
ncbi:hypothetical protein N1851_001446 [Merluccius polli]|uniref:Myb/SANT-like DNA-binding domain-containing protein n=1 Tax=Merluccius polli TaxID=89951 RepID=A0AA47PDQ6_MERPO|nr:hypothetical protein N1851_001446 [Merluccius polli]